MLRDDRRLEKLARSIHFDRRDVLTRFDADERPFERLILEGHAERSGAVPDVVLGHDVPGIVPGDGVALVSPLTLGRGWLSDR